MCQVVQLSRDLFSILLNLFLCSVEEGTMSLFRFYLLVLCKKIFSSAESEI